MASTSAVDTADGLPAKLRVDHEAASAAFAAATTTKEYLKVIEMAVAIAKAARNKVKPLPVKRPAEPAVAPDAAGSSAPPQPGSSQPPQQAAPQAAGQAAEAAGQQEQPAVKRERTEQAPRSDTTSSSVSVRIDNLPAAWGAARVKAFVERTGVKPVSVDKAAGDPSVVVTYADGAQRTRAQRALQRMYVDKVTPLQVSALPGGQQPAGKQSGEAPAAKRMKSEDA